MRLMFKWRKGRKDFQDALRLAWLVIAAWAVTSAIGLFALKDAGWLKQITAASLTLWPFAAYWRILSIHRRQSQTGEGVQRVYSVLLQSMAPCFLMWFVLLYWTV